MFRSIRQLVVRNKCSKGSFATNSDDSEQTYLIDTPKNKRFGVEARRFELLLSACKADVLPLY